jgi:zinc transport system permease protein
MNALYAWLAAKAASGTLPAVFGYPFVVRGLLAVCIVGPLLGGLSHLVIARRLAFFSSALGQAALTGVSIGLVLGEPLNAPYGGLFGFCLLTALAMVFVRRRSALPPDTLVGVFLALTLGLGICLLVAVTKRFNIHQVEAVMFGSLLTVTDADLGLLLVLGTIVGGVVLWLYNRLLLDSLSPALARSERIRSDVLEYAFVLLLTLSIVISLKVIGALLVEAMVVVPAAAARNLAKSARGLLLWSMLLAVLAGQSGILASTQIMVPSGGAVVLSLAALFFLTLGFNALRVGKIFRRGDEGHLD